MSGVEAAGLVLAVLPLLIEALSVYKKGLEKTGIILKFRQKRYKKKIERLRLRLIGQNTSLHLNLTKLLGRAAPSEDFRELTEDYDDVLWNSETREKIKAYLELGGTFEAFQDTLRLYKMCLQEIADNFDGILRPPKANKKDLKALLEANKPDRGHYHFSQRLAFVMKEKRIDDLLNDLSDTALTLRNFVDDNEDLHQIQRLNKEPHQAKQNRVANSLHKVRKHANGLFLAIACGWGGQCHERYGAMLCLESRCQETSHAQHIALRGGKAVVKFTILFSWQEQGIQEHVSWHDISILTFEEDSQQNSHDTRSTSSRGKSVAWSALPDILVASTQVPPPHQSVPIEIRTICKTLPDVRPRVLRLSSDNRLLWREEPPEDLLRPARLVGRTMSLDKFLEEGGQMEPDDRIKLAVNLASSILQYNLTPWLRRCWTKNVIHFLVQTRAFSGIDVEHPLILEQFQEQPNGKPHEVPENDPELALMELGILLLEIWTMRTFESWLDTAGNLKAPSQIQDKYIRLQYSIQWFQTLKGKLLPNYQRVVGICLRPCVFDLFHTSWEDPEFRMAVHREIVEPLLIWGS